MTGAVLSSARSGDRGEEFSRRPRLADNGDDDDDETRKCASVSQTYPSSGGGVSVTSAASAALSWIALHRTDQNLVLEHQRDGDEDEVEDEHREAEAPVHSPSEAGDAHDHEQQHAEQYRYAAHHATRVHLHGFPVD